jgi:hypothetical protein
MNELGDLGGFGAMKEQDQEGCATPVAPSPESVQARVRELRELMREMTNRYLALAQALHKAHETELWTKARTHEGGRYENEEAFWEEVIGVKRRTAYQLISVGEVLAKSDDQAEASKALSGIGLHRLDILVPVLKKEPTIATVRHWADLAKALNREALREEVGKALGRPEKVLPEPGQTFRAYVINQMPDKNTKELAEEFFAVGARYTNSENAVGVLIAAFQEALGTWMAHLPASR